MQNNFHVKQITSPLINKKLIESILLRYLKETRNNDITKTNKENEITTTSNNRCLC